jgi:hypothetical protein
VEESRFNPIHFVCHVARLHVVYTWLLRVVGPVLRPVVKLVVHILWFFATFVQLPVPVRCTLVYGDPVLVHPFDDVAAVTQRAHEALQRHIDAVQGEGVEAGRCYSRALAERWVEVRVARPKLARAVEGLLAPPQLRPFLAACLPHAKRVLTKGVAGVGGLPAWALRSGVEGGVASSSSQPLAGGSPSARAAQKRSPRGLPVVAAAVQPQISDRVRHGKQRR